MAVILVFGALAICGSALVKLRKMSPPLRIGWLAIGLGLLFAGATALLIDHDAKAAQLSLIGACAGFLAGSARFWWLDRRPIWTLDEAFDAVMALAISTACGWMLHLGPMHLDHTGGLELLTAIVLVVTLVLFSVFVITIGSSRSLEAMLPCITFLALAGFATTHASVLVEWRDQTGLKPSEWLAIGLSGAALLLLALSRINVTDPRAWGTSQSFRITMIFSVAALLPICASVAQAIDTQSGLGFCLIVLTLTVCLLGLRFVRFIRQISRLEATRTTRDSLIALPVGALSVVSDKDFESLLASVLDLASTVFGARRAQLSLTFGSTEGQDSFHLNRGLTDTEQTILNTHPRLDPSVCLDSQGRYRPIRVRRDDIVLPVATQGAWAVAGKLESLIVPIYTADRALGLLELWTPNTELSLRDPDLEAAAMFGADAGQAVEHAHLVVRTRAQVEQAEMLLTVSEVFSRGHALDLCLNQIAERLLTRAGADRITIGIIERQRSQILIAAEFDVDGNERPGRTGSRFSLDQWLTYGELRRHGTTQTWSRSDLANIEAAHQAVLDQHDAESLLAIPAYIDGQLSVIIQVVSRRNVLAESAEIRSIWRVVAQQIQFGIESIAALQESRRSERLELLRRRISEALQSVDDLAHNYETIGQAFHRVPDVHGATILSWDPNHEAFVVESDWAEPPIESWDIGKIVTLADSEILSELLQSSGPRMWWQDSSTLTDAQRERMTEHRVGTILTLPLRSEDQLVGGLLLVSHHRHGFGEETVALSTQLASTLGLVMKAIELRRAEADQADEQAFKLQLMEAATSRDDPQQALEAIARLGLGRHGAESIDIAFFDQPNNRTIIAADTTVADWPGVEPPGTPLPIERGSVQERALMSGRMAEFSSLDPDIDENSLRDIETYGSHAWLALPLIVQERPIGLLQVLSRDPGAFNNRRRRLWNEISRQIAPVVRSLQLSMVNERLSLQRQLGGRINEIAAVSTGVRETWDQLAAICLIDDVQCATLLVWHAEDRVLEVESECARPAWLARLGTGERLEDVSWQSAGWTARPNEISHIWLGDSRLSPEGEAFLERFGAGSALIYPLVNKAQIDGLLLLRRNATGAIGQETIELGSLIAAHLAPVIHNLRARDDQTRVEAEHALLLEISRIAASTNDPSVIHDAVLAGILEIAHGSAGWLFAPTAENDAFECVAETHSVSGIWHGQRWPLWAAPLALDILRSPHALVIGDLDVAAISDDFRIGLESIASTRCIAVPIALGKGVQGQIIVALADNRSVTRGELLSMESVADRSGLVIERARATLEEQQLAEQRSILLQVSQAAGNAFDLDRALSEIATASLRIANTESCAIELLEAETDHLIIRGIARVSDWVITEELDGKSRPFGSWAIDEEMRAKQQINLPSIDDPRVVGQMRTDMEHFRTESIVGRALISNGQYIGAYYLFARTRNAYDGNDLWTINEIADRIVAVVQSARSLEAERRLAVERERLLQISEAATSSLESRSVLQQIANSTLGLAGAECCHIEMIDWQQRVFVTEAYACLPDWNQSEDGTIGMRSPIGQWPVDEESISSNSVMAIDSLDDPRVTGQLREDMVAFGTQSILLIPIWLRDECIGILNLYSRRQHAFSLDQQLLASTLAKQAANAIQNARTHALERERRHQQEILVRLSNAATFSLDLNQAMSALCQEIHHLTGIDSATVGIYRSDAAGFEIAADFTVDGWSDRSEVGSVIPISAYGVLEQVTRSQKSVVHHRINTSDESAFVDHFHPDLRDLALIPLWFNDACVGYLGLFDRRDESLTPELIALLESACPTIVLAVSNALQWREERRRAGNRSAVVEVGRVAVSDDSLDTKLDLISAACLQVHCVDAAYIVSIGAHNELGYLAWADPGRDGNTAPPDLSTLDLPALIKRLGQEHGVLMFTSSDPDLPSELRAICPNEQPRSIVAFPLRTDERALGYLVFVSDQEWALDDEVQNVGRELATQVSLTISQSRLLETTRRYASEQSALLAVNRSVMSATLSSLQEALEHIALETMALIDADCCEIEGVLEGQHSTELLAQVAVQDWDWQPNDYGTIYPLADWPVTARVLEQRLPVTMNTDDSRLTPAEQTILSEFGTQSVLIVPMVLGDRVTGTIAFYSRRRDFFSSEQTRLAMEFGSLASLAIDRARTHQALSEQASRDGLTGILNRRALSHHIDHQIAVAERTNDLVSILMIDLNDFKQVNDSHGHLVGDAVLRDFAGQLQELVRASDLVGRYGGDEFMAILPGTDMVASITLARRLYEAVISSPIALPDGTSVTLSCSIGAATYPLDAQDREGLIETADRAMYLTKHANSAPNPVDRTETGSLVLRSSAD